MNEETSDLVDLCKRTVAAVSADGELLGSAFFVANALLVTCAHVVDVTRPLRLHIGSQEYTDVSVVRRVPEAKTVGASLWDPPDLALLRVQSRAVGNHPCVMLGTGTTNRGATAMGIQRLDRILRPVDVPLEGGSTDLVAGNVSLLTFEGEGVQRGMSGGLILDLNEGVVTGIIKAVDNGRVYGISAEAIKQHVTEAWTANEAFHQSDSHWLDCVPVSKRHQTAAKWLEGYLDAVNECDNRASPLLPPGVTRRDVRQPIRVSEREKRREAMADDEPTSQESAALTQERQFYWNAGQAPTASVAIVSGPGTGKSWLLAHHAAESARKALTRVTNNPLSWRSVELPILLDGADLARILPAEPTPEEVFHGLLTIVRRTVPGEARGTPGASTELVKSVLDEAISRGNLMVCVDALDEVSAANILPLVKALGTIRTWCRSMVCAGRTSVQTLLPEIFGSSYTTYQIASFNQGDLNRFVEAWFSGNAGDSQIVLKHLRDNSAVALLASTPLLAACICRLQSENQSRTLPKTRASLLRLVLRQLLSGAWRGAPTDSPAHVDAEARLALLGAAISELSRRWRGRPDYFSRAKLATTCSSQAGYEALSSLALDRWRTISGSGQPDLAPQDALIWEFLYDGVLVESISSGGPSRVRFLHSSFLEVSVANHIASLPRDDAEAIINDHLWFDPTWLEIIPMALGLRQDKDLYGDGIPKYDFDPWGDRSALTVSVAIECDPHLSGRTLSRLARHLKSRLDDGPPGDRARASVDLVRLATLAPRALIVQLALDLDTADDIVLNHRSELIYALAARGAPEALRHCRVAVASTGTSEHLRLGAAEALVRAEDQTGLELVAQALTRPLDSSQRFRQDLASVLTRSFGKSLEMARKLFLDTGVERLVRRNLAVGLVSAGGQGEAEVLAAVVNEGIGHELQCESLLALLAVGSADVDSAAKTLLHNPGLSRNSRVRLCEALLRRGHHDLLPHAFELVLDRDADNVQQRRRLGRTMYLLSDEGQRTLISAARSYRHNAYSRYQAILALVDCNDPLGLQLADAEIISAESEPWLRLGILELLARTRQLQLSSAVVESTLAAHEAQDPTDTYRSRLNTCCSLVCSGVSELQAVGWRRLEVILSGYRQDQPGHAPMVIELLGSRGVSAVNALDHIVGDESLAEGVRSPALLWLGLLDVHSAREWLGLLDGAVFSPAVRQRLVIALLSLGIDDVFEEVLPLMRESTAAYAAVGAFLKGASCRREHVDAALAMLEEPLRFGDKNVGEPDEWFETPAFGSGIEVEEEIRQTWFNAQVTQRVIARVDAMMLPTERAQYRDAAEGDRILGWAFVAEIFPDLPTYFVEEADKLKSLLTDEPNVLPSLSTQESPYEVARSICTLLARMHDLARGKDWLGLAQLVERYGNLLAREPAADVAIWSANEAGGYDDSALLFQIVLYCVLAIQAEKSAGPVVRGLRRLDVGREAIAAYADTRPQLTFLGSAIQRHADPRSPVGYFYAGLGAAVMGDPSLARRMITMSKDRASITQALQGAETLSSHAKRSVIAPELVEELLGLLNSVGM